MTKITFYEKDDGSIIGFQSKGHAGYGMKGTDVVCASVSALIINAMNSIESLTHDKFRQDVNDRRATIQFEMTEGISDESQLLLQSLRLGITEIAKAYPGNVSILYQSCP